MSDDAKHSPGPWRWHDGDLVDAKGASPMRADDRGVYALNEADARLIAAAPELLDAVKRLLEHTDLPPADIEALVRRVEGG